VTANVPVTPVPRLLRLLIVEDLPEDADLLVRALQRAGYIVDWQRVEDEAAYLAALTQPVDLILCDYALPRFSALRALELLGEQQQGIPLIVVTGAVGEETAVACIKRGATDYLLKDRLARLGTAVDQALEQRRLREAEGRAQQDVIASQRRLQAIVENALDAIFVADQKGRYVDVNPAACQLTGYGRSDLLTMSVWDLTTAPDAAFGIATWERFIREGRASGEYQLQRRDGTIVDVEYRAVADVLPDMHVSACRDISARKQAERTRSQLASIVEASNDAIVGKTLDGIVTAWNGGAQRLYGYTADEIIGRSIGELFPPDSSDELDIILTRVRRGERLEDYQAIRYTKDGRRLEITASIFPVSNAAGLVVGAAVITRDMTEKHQRQSETARNENLRALGQLASGVAHDLNQSLALILGYGELLQSELAAHLPGAMSPGDMAVLITRAAQDGGETVKRLLTFARGEPDGPQELVDLSVMLEDVARLIAPRWRDSSQIEGRAIRLAIESEPGLQILGAPHLLREALTNLVFNAVDALPNGGVITLSGRRDGAEVVVGIADTGVGISREAQACIFEPYFTTKGERGSGLGLALVYGIVESHNGGISVASTLGEGTRISLSFPAIEPPTAKMTVVAPCGGQSASLRILTVDDEPAIGTLMARLLESLGHQVTTAQSGEAGLLLLATSPYDVVISDVGMGDGMNGWQFVEQIQQRHPGLPIVLATGWGATIGAEESVRLGLFGVVSKPFRRTDLEKALAFLVARGETRALASAPA
jgi:two-component system cell cycle sensor histidine kinase/response regulator CckA